MSAILAPYFTGFQLPALARLSCPCTCKEGEHGAATLPLQGPPSWKCPDWDQGSSFTLSAQCTWTWEIQCSFVINDTFSGLLTVLTSALWLLKRKSEWNLLSSLLSKFPVHSSKLQGTSWQQSNISRLHSHFTDICTSKITLAFRLFFLKPINRAYLQHKHLLCSSGSFRQFEFLSLPLPCRCFALSLQKQGFHCEYAHYCLTLGNLQRMSAYLIIQSDTISFPDGPDTAWFH